MKHSLLSKCHHPLTKLIFNPMFSSNSPVQIAPAIPEDLPAILAIQSLCYHAIEPESAESILSKILISPESCFVAKINHSIKAYLLSIPALLQVPPALGEATISLPEQPNCLYLHDLAIHPTARNNGISQKLIHAFFKSAKEKKLPHGSLIAIQNSIPFWQKQGFQPVPPHTALSKKLQTYGKDATYMECHI